MQDRRTLEEQASRCRRLASGQTDPVIIQRLVELAEEYEAQAQAAEAAGRSNP